MRKKFVSYDPQRHLQLLLAEYIACLNKFCDTLQHLCNRLNDSSSASDETIEETIDTAERFISIGRRLQQVLRELR